MQTPNGYSNKAIQGIVPDRMYNGLPVSAAVKLPISGLGAPVTDPDHIETSLGNENLTYSPGLVETSGQLSQITVFNPTSGGKVQNNLTQKTLAAGNTLLRTIFAG